MRTQKTITSIVSLMLLGALGTATAAPQNWTGFYVGATAGYAWGEANDSIQFQNDWNTDGSGDGNFLTPYGTDKLNPSGFVGGAEAGYNYQIKNWVLGLAGDFDYLGLDSSFSSGIVENTSIGSTYTLSSSFSTNWLIMLRPRLGYTLGSFLPYITGGLAIGNEKFSQNIQQENNVDFAENASLAHTGCGWTLGAGAEYALLNHWQLMLEYLYVDLPSSSVASQGIYRGEPVNYTASHSINPNINIIRAGLIYSFG